MKIGASTLRRVPASAPDIKRQRVDATHQIGPERSMDGAMPRNTAHLGELWRMDADVEMRLATLAPATMPPMAFAVILDTQQIGRECRTQSLFDFITNSHLLSLGPSNLCKRYIDCCLRVGKSPDRFRSDAQGTRPDRTSHGPQTAL